MRRALVIVALLAACRGEQRSRPADKATAQGTGSAAPAAFTGVPKLPMSEDGDAWMRALDGDIERAAGNEIKLAGLLLERAAIRGWLEDYTRALAVSQTAIEKQPTSIDAYAMRVRVQLAVHAFPQARQTLAKLVELGGKTAADELQVDLDQATGQLDSALAARKARVAMFADAFSVTLYAAALADVGRVDEAIAQIPLATEHLRSNTPQYLAWLLFQWGRLYEQKGQLAIARDFFAEAHRRLPAHVETIAHLAEDLAATGDRTQAKALVNAGDPATLHPTLLALAATLTSKTERLEAATKAWERYVAALPSAFADHAARYYLGIGNNSKRALELAQLNLDARDTNAARTLVVEAALAENDPVRACTVAGPLAASTARADRFLAWRAYSTCGQKAEAARLAAELGMRQ